MREQPYAWREDEVETLRELTEPIYLRLERARAEEKLLENEQRLSLGMRVANIALSEVDYATGIHHLTKDAARVFGLGDEAMTTSRAAVHATFHPDEQEEMQELIAASLDPAGEGWFERDHRIVWSSGEVRWTRARKRVFFEGEGAARRPARAMLALLDITQQKRAEEALKTAHETFRYLVDNSPFGIYAVDADFRLTQVSAGAQKVFENVRPLIGRDFAEVIRIIWPEPFASEVVALFRRTLATGEPYHAPSIVESRRDVDAVESYDWKIERVMLPDGRYGAVCHFYDLSERRRYEEALRQSEERLRIAADATGFGVYDYDPAQDRSTWSDRLFEITGLSPRAYVENEAVAELIYPEDRGAFENMLKQSADPNGSDRHETEFRIVRTDGQTRWLRDTGQSFFEGEGDERCLSRVVGAVLDVTERKQTQQEISDLNSRLQRAVAESHHRIKNNLQMLSALVEMQTPESGETVSAAEFRRIGQHIRALASLHDTLTLESKVSADQDVLSLKASLEKLVLMLGATAGSRKDSPASRRNGCDAQTSRLFRVAG